MYGALRLGVESPDKLLSIDRTRGSMARPSTDPLRPERARNFKLRT